MGIQCGACAYTAAMRTVALVTAVAATGHDDDLVPLLDACADAGLHARAVAWDDPTVNWGRFDTVLLRSPWDYTERLPEEKVWREAITLSTLDPQRHVAVVATVLEADSAEHAVGVARFARASLEDSEAEAAIVVRDDFQRKGLGRILLTTLAQEARKLGITHFCGWVMAENVHLMKLIKKLEVKLESEVQHGQRRVRVTL